MREDQRAGRRLGDAEGAALGRGRDGGGEGEVEVDRAPAGSGEGSGMRSALIPPPVVGAVGSPSAVTSRAFGLPASAVLGAVWHAVALGKARRYTSSGSPPVPFANRISSVPSLVASVPAAEAPATARVDPRGRRRRPAVSRARGEASLRIGSGRGGRRSPPRQRPALPGG